jgi:hypothetical protein
MLKRLCLRDHRTVMPGAATSDPQRHALRQVERIQDLSDAELRAGPALSLAALLRTGQ